MIPLENTIAPTCICRKQNCTIPYGYCHCGCGNLTNISTRNVRANGIKKGEPNRYIDKHVHNKIKYLDRKGCVCGKEDCGIDFGYCHCGCNQKTKINKQSSNKSGCMAGDPNIYKAGHFKKPQTLPEGVCICRKTDCTIEYGLCHCGCGNNTKISEKSLGRFAIKYKPLRFIKGHEHGTRPVYEDAKPFKIDGELCRYIRLTKGAIAIVDAEDYEWLWNYKWFSTVKRNKFYAIRKDPTHKKAGAKTEYMHRLINKTPSDLQCDHIHRNTLDNRKSQLRSCTEKDNKRNVTARHGIVGFRGVVLSGSKDRPYTAKISLNGKNLYLGNFKEAIEAAMAYDRAAIENYGEFAVLNFTKKKEKIA